LWWWARWSQAGWLHVRCEGTICLAMPLGATTIHYSVDIILEAALQPSGRACIVCLSMHAVCGGARQKVLSRLYSRTSKAACVRRMPRHVNARHHNTLTCRNTSQSSSTACWRSSYFALSMRVVCGGVGQRTRRRCVVVGSRLARGVCLDMSARSTTNHQRVEIHTKAALQLARRARSAVV